MPIQSNIKGTVNSYFQIGIDGVVVYQGGQDPSLSALVKIGDVWIDTLGQKVRVRAVDQWTDGTSTGDILFSGTTIGSATDISLSPVGQLLLKGVKWPSETGMTGQTLVLDANNNLIWATASGQASSSVAKYNISGPLVEGAGNIRWYPERPIALQSAYASLGTAGEPEVKISIKINGNQTLSTLTLLPGQYRSSTTAINRSMNTDEWITVDVVAPGGAADAVVYLIYQ